MGMTQMARLCAMITAVHVLQVLSHQIGQLGVLERENVPLMYCFGCIAGAGHVSVTLSHQVGQLGMLERENAAVLNAALLPLAQV